MAELADAQDSGSCEHLVHAGSSPVVRTKRAPVEPKRFDRDFLFVYFSVKVYFLFKKVYKSMKAVDFCGKLI